MQALKKMGATVQEKVGIASAKVDEKKSNAKFAVEEKVEKMKAPGDESAKAEAADRRRGKQEEAALRKAKKEQQNEAEKQRATDPHPGPIGDRPTPADLGMGEENPFDPQISSAPSGPAIPNYAGPFGGAVA